MKISFRKEQAPNTNLNGSCSSCKYAIKLTVSEDFLCNRCGIVDENYICRHYKINHLIKRTPKNRASNDQNLKSRFKKEDFSIV